MRWNETEFDAGSNEPGSTDPITIEVVLLKLLDVNREANRLTMFVCSQPLARSTMPANVRKENRKELTPAARTSSPHISWFSKNRPSLRVKSMEFPVWASTKKARPS